MDRVKDVSKIKVRSDMLLVEIFEKPKSLILTPDTVNEKGVSWDYSIVIAKGSKIEDVEIGDVILSYTGGAHVFEVRDKSYSQLMRHLCDVIVSADNFDSELNK